MASTPSGRRPQPADPELLVPAARVAEVAAAAARLPGWTLTPTEQADLDLLATGGYAPLTGFLTRAEADAVRQTGHLPDGRPWPAPVVLAVDLDTADAAERAGEVALRDPDGTLLAVMTVAERWEQGDQACLAGRLEPVRTSARWDFADLRRPFPALRDEIRTLAARTASSAAHGTDGGSAADGPRAVLAAQPAGHVDARTTARWSRAAIALGTPLVLLPPVGADADHVHVHRIRAYRRLLAHLPDGALLRLVPSGRDPWDRAAAALHAVVARNAGATHLLVEDHLDPAAVASLGLEPVDPAAFASDDDPPAGRLHDDVATEVALAEPPRSRRGLVLLLTGLSGSGKSTVAKVLRARLVEAGTRKVTLLDGDLVRRHLSSELGFSREDRDLNVRRIGYVASEIARHGGIAICAPIAPYDATRRDVRRLVEEAGGAFVLVHVATPLEVCEQRDVKGLYARARAGELTGFTGVDDPYEEPTDAEVVVDASEQTPAEAADRVVAYLVAEGFYDPGP